MLTVSDDALLLGTAHVTPPSDLARQLWLIDSAISAALKTGSIAAYPYSFPSTPSSLLTPPTSLHIVSRHPNAYALPSGSSEHLVMCSIRPELRSSPRRSRRREGGSRSKRSNTHIRLAYHISCASR